MHLAGAAHTRLYLVESPGSMNCPPELRAGGCINTGLKEGCADPAQFPDMDALIRYATARGEGIQAVQTAAQALALCQTPPPAQLTTMNVTQPSGPGTPLRPAPLATGVATPTMIGIPPAELPDITVNAPEIPWGLLMLGVAALFLLRR